MNLSGMRERGGGERVNGLLLLSSSVPAQLKDPLTGTEEFWDHPVLKLEGTVVRTLLVVSPQWPYDALYDTDTIASDAGVRKKSQMIFFLVSIGLKRRIPLFLPGLHFEGRGLV